MNTQYLYYSDVRSIKLATPTRPIYQQTLASSEQVSRPICLEVKLESMVSHSSCFRLFCAHDALELLDNLQDCPNCRGFIVATTKLSLHMIDPLLTLSCTCNIVIIYIFLLNMRHVTPSSLFYLHKASRRTHY